jgi:hypothetical protein
MAITNTQLKTIGFTQVRNSDSLIRAVGDDLIITASAAHLYLNGVHLINTEFMSLDFVKKYIEDVIQGKRKFDRNNGKEKV